MIKLPSQITNDQHNYDNESVNDVPFNGDKNKHDQDVLTKESKTKKHKNIPTNEVIGDSHFTRYETKRAI